MKLKQYINNVTINNKILLVITPLLLFIITLLFVVVYQTYTSIKNSRQVRELVDLTAKMSVLIHHLQKERGASNGYLSSSGENFKNILQTIRNETDKSYEDLIHFLNNNPKIIDKLGLHKYVNSIQNFKKQLDFIRDKIDKLSINTDNSFKFFTDFISFQLDIVKIAQINTNDLYLQRMILAFYDFVYFKEYAGRERAFLSAYFSRKKFTKSQYKDYIMIVNSQSHFQKLFFETIQDLKSFVEIYNNKINKSLEQKVNYYRNIALDENWDENFQSEEWFRLSTERIDNLKLIEDDIRNLINKEAKLIHIKNMVIFISLLFIIFVFAVFIYYMIFIINKSIINRMQYLQDTFTKITSGDLSVEIHLTYERDEIGQMIKMVTDFLNHFKNLVINIKESFEKIDTTSKKLTEIFNNLNQVSYNIKQFSQQLASSSEEMTTNLNIIASSIEEITITLNELSKNSEEFMVKSNEVFEIVKKSNQIIESLLKSTKGIEKTTEIISDMAQQTNLLALNAAIEAANAGEKGAGFAVVAGEVKELANKTKDELININQNIKFLKENVSKTNNVIVNINQNFNELNQFTQVLGASFQEQSTAIKEISNNINQNLMAIEELNKGISKLESMIKEEDSQIEEINSLIIELKSNSEMLKEVLSRYKNY